MKENDHSLPTPQVDAATINALVDALGAVVMCVAKQLPPEGSEMLARDLARISASATANGQILSGQLIADISRAARL